MRLRPTSSRAPKPPREDVVVVRFLVDNAPWHRDETAEVPAEQAAKFVRQGAAVVVDDAR